MVLSCHVYRVWAVNRGRDSTQSIMKRVVKRVAIIAIPLIIHGVAIFPYVFHWPLMIAFSILDIIVNRGLQRYECCAIPYYHFIHAWCDHMTI